MSDNKIPPSKPEPPPKPEGPLVTPPLLEWLRGAGFYSAARLVRARNAFGQIKYGQGLRVEDGRDHVEDARQELGDLLQYAFAIHMKGGNLDALDEGIEALLALRTKTKARSRCEGACKGERKAQPGSTPPRCWWCAAHEG
ncbi:MAG: hypothetical protein GY871_04265 [Actinomycetales bacterium]|nr:hypothetical protein [Actinomycetales bacterium]